LHVRISAKFPKVITHDKRLKDVDKELERFFDAIGPLSDKTLALLIQLPPSLHIFEGLQNLRELVPRLDTRFKYAVELRHTSWFQDLTSISLQTTIFVWSGVNSRSWRSHQWSQPIVYLRLIGDRSVQEKDFGRIQTDRVLEMEKWAENIKNVRELSCETGDSRSEQSLCCPDIWFVMKSILRVSSLTQCGINLEILEIV